MKRVLFATVSLIALFRVGMADAADMPRRAREPEPIPAGAWVHVHNLASDYIATFAHRGGNR